jgi:FkbM family methyltransferase
MKPIWERIVKIFLVVFMVAVVAYVAAWFVYPPFAAAELIAVGRGPDCGRLEAFQAYYRMYKQRDFQANAVRQCRVAQVDPAGFQLTETPRGSFWEPKIEGSAVIAQIAELDAKYAGFEGTPVKKGDIVLDCGANIGTFTRQALDWGAAVVVAIEPAPENIACLRRNFRKEIESGRVIVYPKGVWDKDDVLTLYQSKDTSALDSVVMKGKSGDGIQVPLTTIDKLVAELKLERVDFIKMDIEGAEQKALAGGAQTLRAYRPRMEMSVNHLPEDADKVPAVIRSLRPDYRLHYLQCEADLNAWRIKGQIIYFY